LVSFSGLRKKKGRIIKMSEKCDCGKPAKYKSHAYNWFACEDCVDDKLFEDCEEIREDEDE
jgi:hypothetical protein